MVIEITKKELTDVLNKRVQGLYFLAEDLESRGEDYDSEKCREMADAVLDAVMQIAKSPGGIYKIVLE